jgi:hypothetical protein
MMELSQNHLSAPHCKAQTAPKQAFVLVGRYFRRKNLEPHRLEIPHPIRQFVYQIYAWPAVNNPKIKEVFDTSVASTCLRLRLRFETSTKSISGDQTNFAEPQASPAQMSRA